MRTSGVALVTSTASGDETKSGLLSQAMVAFAGGDGGTHAATLEGPEVGIDERICAAAMRCVARRGLRKTTLDDVATDAGCSRATIYRAFPGGKDVLMAAATERETERELTILAERLAATTSLDDAIVVAVHGAALALTSNQAFVHVLTHEPGVVLPHLSFEGLDPVLARAVAFLAPWLERYVDPLTARRAAEWVARLVVLYSESPDPYDLTDLDDVRRLVDLHVLPGLAATSQQEHPS